MSDVVFVLVFVSFCCVCVRVCVCVCVRGVCVRGVCVRGVCVVFIAFIASAALYFLFLFSRCFLLFVGCRLSSGTFLPLLSSNIPVLSI